MWRNVCCRDAFKHSALLWSIWLDRNNSTSLADTKGSLADRLSMTRSRFVFAALTVALALFLQKAKTPMSLSRVQFSRRNHPSRKQFDLFRQHRWVKKLFDSTNFTPLHTTCFVVETFEAIAPKQNIDKTLTPTTTLAHRENAKTFSTPTARSPPHHLHTEHGIQHYSTTHYGAKKKIPTFSPTFILVFLLLHHNVPCKTTTNKTVGQQQSTGGCQHLLASSIFIVIVIIFRATRQKWGECTTAHPPGSILWLSPSKNHGQKIGSGEINVKKQRSTTTVSPTTDKTFTAEKQQQQE